MNIEDRLYYCFKEVFDKNNSKLRVPLNCSDTVYDLAGFACSDEFLDEMYQRWLNEGNVDKNVN